MLHSPVRRGRPKGTGIDDSDRIARLAELLRLRPDLRPTTAIRLMGFSDPSAIRRLRDKYKVFSLAERIRGPNCGVAPAPAVAALEPAQALSR
jgi:hypothetical protein